MALVNYIITIHTRIHILGTIRYIVIITETADRVTPIHKIFDGPNVICRHLLNIIL